MLTANGATMTNLVSGLSQLVASVDRIVVDRTGLMGTFDVDLRWRSDSTSDPAVDDTNSASLFTALEEQLGLKLERTKGPVDVLVIDHIDHPTPN
jgi:uncharacterized protein (TIGR03435 family)